MALELIIENISNWLWKNREGQKKIKQACHHKGSVIAISRFTAKFLPESSCLFSSTAAADSKGKGHRPNWMC